MQGETGQRLASKSGFPVAYSLLMVCFKLGPMAPLPSLWLPTVLTILVPAFVRDPRRVMVVLGITAV
jgi:hypothetical protein